MSLIQTTKTITSDDVSRAVMLMCPNVDSVSEVANLLIEQTKNSHPDTFAEQAAHFLETMNDLVLTWMAEGKHDELRKLASGFREVLKDSASNPHLLSAMPQHNQLIVRLDVVIRQIAQLLRGDSLAKYMGLLIGSRRESYRELLLRLYRHGAPVMRGQAWRFGPPRMNRAAGEKAVDRMTEMGLLSKQKVGAKNVQIELAWAGQQVAQALVNEHNQSESQPQKNMLELLRGERMTTDLAAVGLIAFEPEDIQAINMA
ncbi:MAG: hypothetical protein C4530_13235 [Desulfobacteraceae bacterium]|nr:MAG: hypothetical protein C4530_13235 [Desulfobacteraceae bacterium]